MRISSFHPTLLLLTFTPQWSLAVLRNVPESEMPSKTSSMLTEINKSVETMNEKATKFVTQLEEMFNRLNKSATRGMADLDSSIKGSLASFEADVGKIFTNASAVDVNACNNYVTAMKESALETMKNVESCVNGVTSEAGERFSVTMTTMDAELDRLTKYQKQATKCTDNDNVKSIDGEPGDSDEFKIYKCVKESKSGVDRVAKVFRYFSNLDDASTLYSGWANQMGCCTSVTEAESYKYATELLYQETEACILKSASLR